MKREKMQYRSQLDTTERGGCSNGQNKALDSGIVAMIVLLRVRLKSLQRAEENGLRDEVSDFVMATKTHQIMRSQMNCSRAP
jgi:transposase